MELFYADIDNDASINRNIFPLKFVFLCFIYLILSISLSGNALDSKNISNNKIISEFNFQENLFPFNKFEIGENNTYFNITKIDYIYSYEFNMVKVDYYIGLYDKNDNLIVPSDLSFYHNIHLLCNLQVPSINLNIESMANIIKDKYHKCSEIFQIDEKIKVGLKIYKISEYMNNTYFFLFDEKRFDLNNETFRNDSYFNPNVIKKEHDKLLDSFNDMRVNETLKLRKSYERYPLTTLKREALLSEGKWLFANLYDLHFCMCKGDLCLKKNITEKCKYYFYITIIDSNKDVYKKTEYVFMDFVIAELSSDDTYPVFKEMIKMDKPVHYITGNLDIYREYCGYDEYCKKILFAPNDIKPIYGDFLEKYISVFFKLKSVISGRPNFNTDLFYFMEYSTYVCVGHGICYFKDWLFNAERIYGNRRNDKIILPDSDILVDIVKKHGWREEDIFRVNLPRWDKLYEMEQENLLNAKKGKKEKLNNQRSLPNYQNNQNQNNSLGNNNINNNNQQEQNNINSTETKRVIKTKSILIMFTWRDLQGKNSLSYDYFKNFYNLISNNDLYKELEIHNITIYLSFHRLVKEREVMKFKNLISQKPLIEFIGQQEISECLGRASLVVTDFSSIIFDLMFRKKPFIIFIPDGHDSNIKRLYKPDYYGLIEAMRNGTLEFENKFFSVSDTVSKIIFYIQVDFALDQKLERFYQMFGFKMEKSIDKFIDYLEKLN